MNVGFAHNHQQQMAQDFTCDVQSHHDHCERQEFSGHCKKHKNVRSYYWQLLYKFYGLQIRFKQTMFYLLVRFSPALMRSETHLGKSAHWGHKKVSYGSSSPTAGFSAWYCTIASRAQNLMSFTWSWIASHQKSMFPDGDARYSPCRSTQSASVIVVW